MANLPDWLWIAAGWCAVALGAWLLLTGRRNWKRITGRCCRRCQYNMAGLSTMTCPECGRVARSERELKRLPARKRWRLAGLVLVCVGWLLWQAPAVIRHGWAGGVPGWVLATWVPVKTDGADATTVRERLFPARVIPGFPTPTKSKPLPRPKGLQGLRSDLYLETWRRIQDGEMSDAMAARYLRRVFGITPEQLRAKADLPPAWPSDRDFPSLDPLYDASGSYLLPDATCRVVARDSATVAIVAEVDVNGHVITLEEVETPLDLSTPSAGFMRRVDTPEVTAELVRALQPSLSVGRGTARVEFTGRKRLGAGSVPWALSMKVRVVRGERVVATGTCEYEPHSKLGYSPVFAYVRWQEGELARAASEPEGLELEIESVPRQGIVDYLTRATELREVWSGRVRVTPRVLRDSE